MAGLPAGRLRGGPNAAGSVVCGRSNALKEGRAFWMKAFQPVRPGALNPGGVFAAGVNAVLWILRPEKQGQGREEPTSSRVSRFLSPLLHPSFFPAVLWETGLL